MLVEMRGKKIREPFPLHSKFLNPLFICAVILPHGKITQELFGGYKKDILVNWPQKKKGRG